MNEDKNLYEESSLDSQHKWEPLNLSDIPKAPGVYGWKWRGKWFYIGESTNLAKRLNAGHVKFSIARSLSNANFFWIPTTDHRRTEIQQKRLHNPEWQSIGDGYNFFGSEPQCLIEQSPYNVKRWDRISWELEPEMVSVNIDLSRSEIEDLDCLCAKEGVSRSEAIKLLLSCWKTQRLDHSQK